MRRRVLLLGGAGLIGVAALAYGLDRPAGYGATVDFKAVLGPPPAVGSAEAAAEKAVFAKAAAGIGSSRWTQAGQQVFPTSPEVTAEISCALGRQVSPATTPVTSRLMANAAADLRRPVEAAKSFYQRDRPFVGATDTRTCDPRTLGALGGSTGGTLSYAYPSGHAAYGRIWGRVLGDAAPGQAAVVAAWGQRLGDNRIVCRVHWPSDVVAGRKLADAVYGRLASMPAFRKDVAAARAELARAPVAAGCAPH